jgi:hypothetical protein
VAEVGITQCTAVDTCNTSSQAPVAVRFIIIISDMFKCCKQLLDKEDGLYQPLLLQGMLLACQEAAAHVV